MTAINRLEFEYSKFISLNSDYPGAIITSTDVVKKLLIEFNQQVNQKLYWKDRGEIFYRGCRILTLDKKQPKGLVLVISKAQYESSKDYNFNKT